MTHGTRIRPACVIMPRFWRMLLIALCTLILCSCHAGGPSYMASHSGPGDPFIPAEMHGVGPGQFQPPFAPVAPPTPLPSDVTGPWSPPGLPQPWPPNEYLADGGDYGYTATVKADWEVRGLEPADTIAHFDTLDGQTVVQASNRVHIYSPRFGAVRQVVSLMQNDQIDRFLSVHQPVQLIQDDDYQAVVSSKQQEQVKRYTVGAPASVYHSRQGDGLVSSKLGPLGFQNAFQPYEACSAIRYGLMEASEMAWLAKGTDAAVTWTQNQCVEVILDHQRAAIEIGDRGLRSFYRVEEPPAKPKLRIMKVASTQLAAPGDTVDFTLRFDNVGNQVIGNVTIIDNLTTRLEYEADSAQCSIGAEFLTQPNEANSLVLRWEIQDPLLPGKGGIIRFRCRVR
jgi:uncharacterized repeat protein (TIGR01451 family)